MKLVLSVRPRLSAHESLEFFRSFALGPVDFLNPLLRADLTMIVRPRYLSLDFVGSVPLREFLEGFATGMATLGAMLVLTALADKLL